MQAYRWAPIAAVLSLATLAACGPGVPNSVAALDTPPSIANLVKERLRQDLLGQNNTTETPPPFAFPGRIGIIPYDFQSTLGKGDQLTEFNAVAANLQKHPELAKSVQVLPAEYGDSIGASFEALMRLRSSTNCDAFFLISGRTRFAPATEKSVGFFDWIGHKSYWEASAALTALWAAPSGSQLPSIQAATKVGPSLCNPEDDTTSGVAYGMRRSVEAQAFDQVGNALVAQLTAERLNAPTPMPTPSPTPSTATVPHADMSKAPATPTPLPTATATPTPAATATAEATGTPTPAPTATADKSATP